MCQSRCNKIYKRYKTHNSFKIPKPTWSIDDLDLTFQKEKPKEISDAELDHLAQKAMLNVSHLTANERDDLKLQLSKIMKCISLVTEMNDYNNNTSTLDVESDEIDISIDHTISEIDMYDTPRGFSSPEFCTPVRNEDEELLAWKEYSKKQSHTIMEHLKDEKMVVRNGERYFQLIVGKKNNVEDS